MTLTRAYWRSLILAAMLALTDCGGGPGGGSITTGPTPLPTGANVEPIFVDSGPAGTVNTPFVSVTICAPGTSNCQSVDHVLLDTGSSGLRLVASVLSASLNLPAARDSAGNPTAECGQFADGSSFGPLKLADVKIANQQANNLPVHVVGDPSLPTIPADCLATGPPENSVQALGANGVLGVSVFREDCGSACVTLAVPAAYYRCPSSGCVPMAMPLAGQLQNPVWRFAGDNNGVAIVLRSVDPVGAPQVLGALVLGVGTQSNNALATATVLKVDPNFGTLTTIYNGQSLRGSVLDTGSNGLFFADSSLPVCVGSIAPDFYCPQTVQSRTATLQSTTGTVASVSFEVANAVSLLGNNTTFVAFSRLAGTNPIPNSFDWGLPFFFGRTVFVAIEGQQTPSGPGPFLAY